MVTFALAYAQTTLAANISPTDTLVTFVDDSKFLPLAQFDIRVGNEIMSVLRKTRTGYKVRRSRNGYGPMSHATGSRVTQILSLSPLERRSEPGNFVAYSDEAGSTADSGYS